MATKRDLFHSYQFSVRRVVSGLVLRETDPAQTPLRRMGGAMFGSVMVAVLALAVTGVVGVIKGGGNTSWKDGGSVIVEKETGATYAWLQDAGTKEFALHPVLNYSSAALLVGSPDPVSVSHASLIDVPRGPRLGIPGAPDSIPPSEDFAAGPWTLCSEPAKTDAGMVAPSTALLVGTQRSAGTSVGAGSIVVKDAQTAAVYLLWNGHRFRLPQADVALTALGLRDAPQIEVGTAMLTSLPEGPAIAPLSTPAAGTPSSVVAGRAVGQVLVDKTTKQFYLVRAKDLRSISPVEASVTLSAPATAAAYGGSTPTAVEVDNAVVTSVPRVDLPPATFNDAPREIPEPAPVAGTANTVCATFASGSAKLDLAVDAPVEGAQLAPATAARTENGTVLADRVLVPGGHAALVRSIQSASATDGPLFLVTDQGIRFAVADEEAAAALGLDAITPLEMPATLVARIPAGPALDVVSARSPG
ncbi:type VII secretion protein EccB [Cumulibacter manganitolerans]|uniref:type VII secretion protein EccB n=1 Tax=Cumulibacter manganitolerans TaxID=1884992 RepID=UPI001297D734|nr:type VII secretion protein EccB [Cumulibacter manganitolerans]